MAVPAVTLNQRKTMQIDGASFGIIAGSVNVTSYDTAHPELTALTGKFRNKTVNLAVVANGVSSAGYLVRWDDSTLSFKAFVPGTIAAGTPPAASTITLGASPATYTNNDGVPELIILTGGTVSAVTMTRGGFTSASIFAATPVAVLLQQGDSLTVTYSVAPTVQEKLPFAAAAVAAAEVEAANAAPVGTFDFIALGQMG